MRKHSNKFLTVMITALAVLIGSLQVFAAETQPVVETITLDENLSQDSEILVDLSWKTAQDKGQWIEESGIAKDAHSLILVINNLDKMDPNAIPAQSADQQEEKRKSIVEWSKLQGKSRLYYFSKTMEGEWNEFFSVDCFISGGSICEKEDLYGVYEPVSSFGSYENPGSLLPYRSLSGYDYWSIDPESEHYGSIVSSEKTQIPSEKAVSLAGLKSYSNYGMILHPEAEDSICPPLVINCQQKETGNSLLSGLQMPQSYLRMMIQTIDKDTRFIIVENLGDLENM